MKPLCSIFFHNYYGANQSWLDYFENISFPANLYYNIAEDSLYNTEPGSLDFSSHYKTGNSTHLKEVFFRQSPNQGKDIGGKLVLMDAYQKLGLQTEYGLFLHDKKSPYKANSETWASNLLKIAEKGFAENALKLFKNKPGTGIVTANGNTGNEFDYAANDFKSNNKILLPELQKMFDINPTDYGYVNGTMFWFRMEPLTNFFQKNPPLQIRAMLEKGNVSDEYQGTYTHSWERLLCWIITSQNYTIKTI
jgi:lipopolysaccharide biosynthesis protein